MRLLAASLISLVACAHANPEKSAASKSAEQRIEVLLPTTPGVAMRSVQAAARDLDLPPGRVSGGVMRSEFSAGPYHLRSNQSIEVALHAVVSAAGGMGQGSRVLVTGTMRAAEGSSAAQSERPIVRPTRGEDSPSWDELERFAVAVRNHQ